MKIAIIGGGICGLYLAKNLAQKKNTVTVFERKNAVGKECCSGLFSSHILDLIPESGRLSSNRINGAIINFPRKTIRLKFHRPFFVIEHAQLDRLMAKMAIDAGARITFGKTIADTGLDKAANEYDRVIGCDGALSPTRAYLGLKNPDFMLGIQGVEQKTDNTDFVETWATKNGFLWKIPRGKNIEWGIMDKPESAAGSFNKFITQKNLKLDNIKSAIIPQGLVIPNNGKITLCGDASGLTKPWSGGGVVWNLTQARFLLKNFPDFLQYNKEALRFFSLRVGLGKFAKTAAYAAGFKFPWIMPENFKIDGDYLIKRTE